MFMSVNLENKIQAAISPQKVQNQVQEYEKQKKSTQETRKQSLEKLDAEIQAKVNTLKPRLATDTYVSKLDDELNRKLAIRDAKMIKLASKIVMGTAFTVAALAAIGITAGIFSTTYGLVL